MDSTPEILRAVVDFSVSTLAINADKVKAADLIIMHDRRFNFNTKQVQYREEGPVLKCKSDRGMSQEATGKTGSGIGASNDVGIRIFQFILLSEER